MQHSCYKNWQRLESTLKKGAKRLTSVASRPWSSNTRSLMLKIGHVKSAPKAIFGAWILLLMLSLSLSLPPSLIFSSLSINFCLWLIRPSIPSRPMRKHPMYAESSIKTVMKCRYQHTPTIHKQSACTSCHYCWWQVSSPTCPLWAWGRLQNLSAIRWASLMWSYKGHLDISHYTSDNHWRPMWVRGYDQPEQDVACHRRETFGDLNVPNEQGLAGIGNAKDFCPPQILALCCTGQAFGLETCLWHSLAAGLHSFCKSDNPTVKLLQVRHHCCRSLSAFVPW